MEVLGLRGFKSGRPSPPSDSANTGLFRKGAKRTLRRPKGLFMELFFLAAETCTKPGVNRILGLRRPPLTGAAASGARLCAMLNRLAGGKLQAVSFAKILLSAWKGSEQAPGSLLLGRIQPSLAYFKPQMRLFFYGEGASTENSPGVAKPSLLLTVTRG